MKSRLFRNCAYISTVLFLVFVALFAYVWFVSPNSSADWSYFSLGKDIHIAVTKKWGGNMVFFNEGMPYAGSVISLTGDKTINERGVTGWGIYFRLIENTTQNSRWWTLMISFWYPVILFGILPLVFAVRNCARPKQEAAVKNE
jgi:hypothetical protein